MNANFSEYTDMIIRNQFFLRPVFNKTFKVFPPLRNRPENNIYYYDLCDVALRMKRSFYGKHLHPTLYRRATGTAVNIINDRYSVRCALTNLYAVLFTANTCRVTMGFDITFLSSSICPNRYILYCWTDLGSVLYLLYIFIVCISILNCHFCAVRELVFFSNNGQRRFDHLCVLTVR